MFTPEIAEKLKNPKENLGFYLITVFWNCKILIISCSFCYCIDVNFISVVVLISTHFFCNISDCTIMVESQAQSFIVLQCGVAVEYIAT